MSLKPMHSLCPPRPFPLRGFLAKRTRKVQTERQHGETKVEHTEKLLRNGCKTSWVAHASLAATTMPYRSLGGPENDRGQVTLVSSVSIESSSSQCARAESTSSLVGVEVPTMFDTQQQFDDRLYAASVTDITIPYPDPDAQMYYSEERLQNITKDLTAVFVGQMPQNGPSVLPPNLCVVLLTIVAMQRSTLCARPVHQLQRP